MLACTYIHRLTFEGLCFQDLAAGLMLKLIVLTQEVVTERAAEDAASYDTQYYRNTSSMTKQPELSECNTGLFLFLLYFCFRVDCISTF